MTNILEVSGLYASYGKAEVLHDINFSIEEGGIAVVLGANGAGKTTILRALSGIVRPRGSIIFNGEQIVGSSIESIAQRGMAHVPQGRGTFGTLTVEENLRAGGMKQSKNHINSAIEKWFDFFPRLRERARQPAAGLSGGEQQMLAIARALISEPRLLLLDEPSLGLAPKITQNVFTGLETINRDSGTTILVVEQNAHLALEIASTGVVIDTGNVVTQGLATDLQNNEDIRRAYLGY